MKLITYTTKGVRRVGSLYDSNQVIDLRSALEALLRQKGQLDAAEQAMFLVPSDMTVLLDRAKGDLSLLREAAATAGNESLVDHDTLTLEAPIPRPGKILGVGRNYGAHAGEGGLLAQDEPRIFAKMPTSVIGTGASIPCPASVNKLDWEVELAVVIGRNMKDIPEPHALEYIAGYTIINDVSAREFQFDVKPPQTTFAKSMDGFTPMGPVLLTADELTDPTNVQLRCWVNDTLMQEGNTSDMIFPVAYILSYLSRFMTLEPGDVIATGTPSGVGCFRDPPMYLTQGDQVRMEIPPIGVLANDVRRSA
ncbi:fumarylacetoacetate hydrolase family protein [Halomonas sp. QX-2]|uniref:Fumarylacetoacetate hydrolase family protein n=1 Tax=Vreelandella sedimenti TaxID=2729618 RepID=A0A7Z0SNN5_9GAMM|nr:fumarylacetoacetate hydrolase family protein [Halomonas sedimenti]NYT74992.1 fumarylacetoacetate hydrolase family protein [Halomonas sedimenti]